MKKAGFLSLLALVCVSIALVSHATSGTQVVNKIHGGREAKPGEFPFMAIVRLGPKGKQFDWCGASLIDDRYLLSAAHCMPNDASVPLAVKLGCHDLREPCVEMEIENFLEYEGFNREKRQFDISIMRLKEPVKFTGPVGKGPIEPIKLPESMDGDYKVDEPLMTIGWGQLNSANSANVLMKIDVSAWSLEQCIEHYKNATEAFICAGSPTQGVCQGDSGGPLFRVEASGSSTLLGITADWSGRCGVSYGSAFTRVAYFQDWIEDGKKRLEAASSTPIVPEDEPMPII